MAILDRPLFQRRLTKEELKAYGIPAFANGGVVQKFAPGGDVNKPDYSDNFTKPINVKEKFDIATTGMLDEGAKQEAIQQGTFFSPTASLKEKIDLLEKTIAYKEANGIDASADKAELASLKSQLAQEQQKVTSPKEEETETDATGTVTDAAAPEKEITEEEDELSRLKTLALERSDLYKQMLGDPKEMMKQQGLLQLAQFGLNLASARGGNLAEKIAKSARDPLQAFAQLASDASKDARAIDLAAIKSAEDQLALETELAGKQDDLVKVNLYLEAKSEMPGNDVGAATATTYLPKSEMVDIDLFRDDQDRIVSKDINNAGGANKVYTDIEGKPYRIKPGALQKEKYLKWPDDFELIEGVEIITSGN